LTFRCLSEWRGAPTRPREPESQKGKDSVNRRS
jgi:hypothetical protein